jgi:hypothetical protein
MARLGEYYVDVASDARSDFAVFPEIFTTQLMSFLEERSPICKEADIVLGIFGNPLNGQTRRTLLEERHELRREDLLLRGICQSG